MTDRFNPLNHSICLAAPQRLVFPNSWVTHIPFAMYVISALKPSIFVELGTHTGNSYCGFCQAVATLSLETKCYAVDTWEGDEHAGFYGSEVFEELSKYHDPKYSSFSRLLKMTFDEAKDYFSDNSISLLHIDGLHTYEAVKHDFENWKQKLSQNAIVIFHDTNVRERGFGVWKYWEEIATEYPHFEFLHGNGLGILCLGNPDQAGLAGLFDPNNLEDIRAFFSCVGAKYNFPIEKDQLQKVIQENDRINIEKLNVIDTEKSRLNQIIQKLTGDLAERDQIVQKLTGDLAERDQIVQKLTGDLAERDQNAEKLTIDLAERDQIVEKLTGDMAERDQANSKELQKICSEQNRLEQELVTQVSLKADLEQSLNFANHEIVDYFNSTSWKITRPLRWIMKKLRGRNVKVFTQD